MGCSHVNRKAYEALGWSQNATIFPSTHVESKEINPSKSVSDSSLSLHEIARAKLESLDYLFPVLFQLWKRTSPHRHVVKSSRRQVVTSSSRHIVKSALLLPRSIIPDVLCPRITSMPKIIGQWIQVMRCTVVLHEFWQVKKGTAENVGLSSKRKSVWKPTLKALSLLRPEQQRNIRCQASLKYPSENMI